MELEQRRLRVLVVDDDARSARLLAILLREDGYDVDLAFDGEAAIVRLAEEPPVDVLVTDLRMPRAGGIAVAEAARLRYPTLPIFVVTAYPELVDRRALTPHMSVFDKPIEYPLLVEALRDPLLLERKS